MTSSPTTRADAGQGARRQEEGSPMLLTRPLPVCKILPVAPQPRQPADFFQGSRIDLLFFRTINTRAPSFAPPPRQNRAPSRATNH